jgi:outer membrane protein TolC
MAIETAELDQLQADYKAAVDNWIAAIRTEEALASVNHDIADVDAWEHADNAEEEAREKAKDAKLAYEDGLREKFYNF